MKTLAIAALIAVPALARKMAYKDDSYADYEQEYKVDKYRDDYSAGSKSGYSKKTYSDDSASISNDSVDINSVSNNSIEIHTGSNYSVNDVDQYHNTEDNNQSPDVDYAQDTTTQNVNFRINLLKQGKSGCCGAAKKY